MMYLLLFVIYPLRIPQIALQHAIMTCYITVVTRALMIFLICMHSSSCIHIRQITHARVTTITCVQYAKPLGRFWYQILLSPICLCIHFQVWFCFTWPHFFIPRVFSHEKSLLLQGSCNTIRPEILTHIVLATLVEVDQNIGHSHRRRNQEAPDAGEPPGIFKLM